MKSRHLLKASIIATSLVLGGCAGMSKEQIGMGAGAAAGGLAGSLFGKGSGKTAATIAGVVAGGLIGKQIGAGMDERDRKQALEASQKAFETGARQQWRNPETGNSGNVQIVNKPAAVSTSGPTSDRPCRTAKQTLNLQDGSTREEEVTACKGPNGWERI